MTKDWKLPKNWKYNVKEFRLENRVPVYDENDNYSGHYWVALVPDDIKQFISDLLEEQKKELLEEVNNRNKQLSGCGVNKKQMMSVF